MTLHCKRSHGPKGKGLSFLSDPLASSPQAPEEGVSKSTGAYPIKSAPKKKKGPDISVRPFLLMARLERFELPTYGFVVRCSIQLSYKRNLYQLAGM